MLKDIDDTNKAIDMLPRLVRDYPGDAVSDAFGSAYGLVGWWDIARGAAVGAVNTSNVVALTGAAALQSVVGTAVAAVTLEAGIAVGAGIDETLLSSCK